MKRCATPARVQNGPPIVEPIVFSLQCGAKKRYASKRDSGEAKARGLASSLKKRKGRERLRAVQKSGKITTLQQRGANKVKGIT